MSRPGPVVSLGSSWRDALEHVAPTVLLLGGYLTSPPFYVFMRRRLLERGAAAVVVGRIWLPDWILAGRYALGPIVNRAGKGLVGWRALGRLGGLPWARSSSSVIRRVGSSPGSCVRSRSPAASRWRGPDRAIGDARHAASRRRGGAHRAPAVRRAPRVHRPRRARSGVRSDDRLPSGDLAPSPAAATGTGGSAGHRVWRIVASSDRGPLEGDSLVPSRSASLAGVETLVLDGIAHGQSTHHPRGTLARGVDAWWPRAVEVWRAALYARAV
jgi:hypothetical protein